MLVFGESERRRMGDKGRGGIMVTVRSSLEGRRENLRAILAAWCGSVEFMFYERRSMRNGTVDDGLQLRMEINKYGSPLINLHVF
jgi:hypothetical protein